MSDLERAYQSLNEAKEERKEQTLKLEELEEICEILKPYCRARDYARYYTINEKIETIRSNNRDALGSILFIVLVYLAGFGAVDFMSVFLAGNIGVVVPSILAFIGCIAFSTPVFVKRILGNRKEIKSLKRAERSLGKSSEYSKKSINQLVKLIEEAKESLNVSISELDEAIAEYEEKLGKVNEDIAEEVLAKSGIEADVTLNSSMKVLSKRYEPKK